MPSAHEDFCKNTGVAPSLRPASDRVITGPADADRASLGILAVERVVLQEMNVCGFRNENGGGKVFQ